MGQLQEEVIAYLSSADGFGLADEVKHIETHGAKVFLAVKLMGAMLFGKLWMMPLRLHNGAINGGHPLPPVQYSMLAI